MDQTFVEEIRQQLLAEKAKILGFAQKARAENLQIDEDDLPDEVDQASSEYNQTIALRLRGREKKLLSKIDETLLRIAEGDFGHCEECGEPIGEARLRAWPVATHCIACKEEQERREKNYG